MTDASPYRLLRSSSCAAEFHARPVGAPAEREVWQHELTASALVLGSSQAESVIDAEACRRAGVEVVRRRSGGGAVLLRPGEVTWIDVIVPAGSPGWADDIHVPMVWLGRHLASVIGDLLDGVGELGVHEGPMATTPWSSLVCFDGLGAGEVTLDGRKLVGISQRRTRHAARLQCCWYSSYRPEMLVDLLAPQTRPHVADLAPVATLPRHLADSVPVALLDHLR